MLKYYVRYISIMETTAGYLLKGNSYKSKEIICNSPFSNYKGRFHVVLHVDVRTVVTFNTYNNNNND